MLERCYSELIRLPTFEERFEYLKIGGAVGIETLGSNRYLGQQFYQRSREWKSVRDRVIVRDCGCDLAMEDREIFGRITIHHMNPARMKDFLEATQYLLDPEFLICVSYNTHQAIHYSDESLLMKNPIARVPNDTCPWRH